MTQHDWFPDSSADADTWSLDAETVAPYPDELFRALNDRTRRQILFLLFQQSAVSVETLVEMINSSRQSDEFQAGLSEQEQTGTDLEHVHLPLLADVGIVTYDRIENEVQLEPLATPVEELIQFAISYERAYRQQSS